MAAVRVRYELPAFTPEDATRLALEHFGLRAAAQPLPSERDQNFYLRAEDGAEFVLKIANAAEAEASLDLQNKTLEHLAARAPQLPLARVCPARSGATITTVAGPRGGAHPVRLLTYIPGQVWAATRPHTAHMRRSLGRVLGTLDAALQDFEHPAAHRTLKWDITRASWIRDYFSHLDIPERRALVERFLAEFEATALPRLPALRASIIYNDANDYNILVAGDPRAREVVSVIDFGDMLYTRTVCEVAIAAAYAMLGAPDPLSAAADVVAGYHSVFPLAEAELEVLYPLICARLCVTVTNAAFQRHAEPGNDYLLISERPAWDLLEKLAAIPPRLAHYTLRAACGLEPCPAGAAVARWLAEHTGEMGPLVDVDSGARTITLDLSAGSLDLGNWPDFEDGPALRRNLLAQMQAAGAAVAVGRYGEARPFDTRGAPRGQSDDGPEWASVHLGLDVFCAAGTPVLAPLPGVVQRADAPGPGATMVLRHSPAGAPEFFSLYRHLSPAPLAVGQRVERGAVLGQVPGLAEHAPAPGSPPMAVAHLHLQLAADLLEMAALPGRVLPAQRAAWFSVCPDPNLMARPAEGRPAGLPARDQLLAQRRDRLGPNLSVSYSRPLSIVRGYRQFLYDQEGRALLDAVNNVAHVGHSHPTVARAIERQARVLNTNTRYLHANILRYAERLSATLPAPLRVCYFVNSGSEANELALRLARAYTGRRGVVVLEAAYHGNTGGLIDISPYKHAGPGGAGAPAHVHVVPMPDAYRGRYCGDPQAAEKFAGHVAEAAQRAAAEGHPVGAFMAESLLSCGGQVVLPGGYLAAAYRYARAAGAVCIADEVQVGFGRVGSHFWGFETQAVVPDIVTLGKPIGNGFPLGAVVTTPEIAAAFDNGMEYFNTYGGNPVACAVGLAVLDVLEAEGLQANALRVGQHLLRGLRSLMDRHAIIGDVRGLGLFLGVELVLDRGARTPAGSQAGYVADRARELGVLLSTDGPDHNVLKIKPPLVFTRADADRLLAVLDQVLGEDFVRR